MRKILEVLREWLEEPESTKTKQKNEKEKQRGKND